MPALTHHSLVFSAAGYVESHEHSCEPLTNSLVNDTGKFRGKISGPQVLIYSFVSESGFELLPCLLKGPSTFPGR